MKTKPTGNNGNDFFGWVTISSKGQIAIPADIRKLLKIKTGERLLIVLRKDQAGINLIKANEVDKIFRKYSN
ncbi:MAG: AbrB/MazE/SpoVT family DNA-binding domain-containing protein [Patescibacteria group bacterium]|jgi:AbrB family looped-hinge helix DNA binding protein